MRPPLITSGFFQGLSRSHFGAPAILSTGHEIWLTNPVAGSNQPAL
jgi:hypothetical protein